MKRVRSALSSTLVLALVAGAGCEPAPPADVPADSVTVSAPGASELPIADTTAEAVLAHLDSADYTDAWMHWPDRSPFYEGQDPHGMLLSTRLNPRAARGLQAMTVDEGETLPFGSIVVKDNYAPDSTLVATTVMYKQQHYDPENHDWFWVKRLADGTVEAAGRADGCISCHEQAAGEWDYLMTARAEAGADD